MNTYDRQHLLAEQNFLREQLESMPASARLTRMSTQARLQSIEAQLAEMPINDCAGESSRYSGTESGLISDSLTGKIRITT